MKKQDLIKKLQELDCENVVIFDVRKAVFNADYEPNSIGIQSNFKVTLVTKKDGATKPFIAIEYENDDYTGEGDAEQGSLLYDYIARKQE